MKNIRGNRKRNRKVHPHPSTFKIPKTVKIAEKKIRVSHGDDGTIRGNYGWTYHPTKGWRRRNIVGDGFNLTRALIDNSLRAQNL